MPTRILVTFFNPYDMKTEDGDRRKGCSVEYLFYGENGEMCESHVVEKDEQAGIRRAKDSLPAECASKFAMIPGIYDGKFVMRVGADGKPVNRLVDVNYIGPAKITLDNFSTKKAVNEKA